MRKQIANLLAGTLVLVAGWYYALVALPSATRATPGSYGRWVMADLSPSWYATRAVLIEHRSPYSDDVTRQSQRAMYGRTIEGTRLTDEQRFAYPVFAVFPLFPMLWLSLAAAQKIAFWAFMGLNFATTWLWSRAMEVRCTFLLCCLVMAEFPFTMAIILRQPTVLYLFLLALAAYLAKSGRHLLAGSTGAVCLGKPQLALAVLLPILLWSAADWRGRKRILLGFGSTLAILLVFSLLLVPKWISEWVRTMAAYSKYGNVTPLFFSSVSPLIGLLALAVVLMLWKVRQDLSFGLALSVASFSLVLPFQYYNLGLVLPAVLWIWRNRGQLKARTATRLAYALGPPVWAAGIFSLGLACVVPSGMRFVFVVSVVSFVILGFLPLIVLPLHYIIGWQRAEAVNCGAVSAEIAATAGNRARAR